MIVYDILTMTYKEVSTMGPGITKPEWVTRKGGGGKRYKVYLEGKNFYEISLPDGHMTLPREDYEPCPPPVEDVTDRLYIHHGEVRVMKDGDTSDTVAKLCCNGNYKVSFHPFKVERIS